MDAILNMVLAAGLLLAGTWSYVTLPRHARQLGLETAKPIALGLGFLTLGISLVLALDQLGLASPLMRQLVLVVFGAICLAAALAVGLGMQDVVSGLVSGYLVRRRLRAGDHVKVAGLTGTVREVGAMATVIEADDADGLTHRHSVPNRCMLNEAIQ